MGARNAAELLASKLLAAERLAESFREEVQRSNAIISEMQPELGKLKSENQRLRDEIDGLRSALERTRNNFVFAIAGKPVRDMAETLAECDQALASSEHPQS